MQIDTIHTYRQFGLVVGGIFLAIGLLSAALGSLEEWGFVPLAIGGVLIFFGLIAPAILKYPYILWMKLGELLHRIINPIILGVMFFVIYLPIGLLMRLFRYDPLKQKYDPKADSYWHVREPGEPKPDTMNHQF